MPLPHALRRRLSALERLTAAGASRRSLLAHPVRRRLPTRAARLELRTGETWTAPRDEQLLTIFDEVWSAEAYTPHSPERVRHGTVVDVGANVGVFAVWAARRLQARRVVAVEPAPETAHHLRLNLERNRVEATPIQRAVAGESGERVLNRRGAGSMSTLYGRDRYGSTFGAGRTVTATRLSSIFAEAAVDECALLKLDCEGAEYEILYAATDVLPSVDQIVLEYHVGLNEHRPAELEAFLRAQGFAVELDPPLDVEGGHLRAWRPERARP